MDIRAKQELAVAFNETVRIHEASYDKTEHRYTMDWHTAAERGCADKDLVVLVYAMAAGGYCEYSDWAEKFAPKLRAV
jgi:hypothetical protein